MDVAARHGAGEWQGNVAYVFANTGAFVTSLVYCLYLARRNRSLGELRASWAAAGAGQPGGQLRSGNAHRHPLVRPVLLLQSGHVRMGKYAFTSWAIHMIMLVLFSNLLAVFFREWKGCRPRTRWAISIALAVLVAAILLLTYGNFLAGCASDRRNIARPPEERPLCEESC